MNKNLRNGLIIVVSLVILLLVSVFLKFDDLKKQVFSYNSGYIKEDSISYKKIGNEDFNYINIDTNKYKNIAFLNKNHYFKNNINVYDIDSNKILYIDPFQEYKYEDEIYTYGGLYVNEDYYKDFLNTFDTSKYYTEMSTNKNIKPKELFLSDSENKLIKDIILNNDVDNRLYDGIKHDLSETSYELKLKSSKYDDIYIKIRVYRTKNNDLVIKFNNKIYNANELKENKDINSNAAYYIYKGDDYGYLYNTINTEDDLKDFAFHDFIIQDIPKEAYKNYVNDVFKVINNRILSLEDKVVFIKQLLYSKYKPTLREDFALKIERLKNLNIINDHRKTYRINHKFLFDLFNYPANLYSLSFYEDDLLYNIPERYKEVYETYVRTIIDDPDIDYLKKNDMVVEIQNKLVVVDEKQLEEMKKKYGEIEVLEESYDRIKYAPGYYGFLYDKISNIEDLKKFALHEEVLDNILTDYFRNKYKEKVENIIKDDKINLQDKVKEVAKSQLQYTLMPIEKQDYYREKYGKEYYNESYISKIKSILE